MIEQKIHDHFKTNGFTWHFASGDAVPSVEDIEMALDEAARRLKNEEVGAELIVGRLIITKRHRGHDVFVFVGNYD